MEPDQIGDKLEAHDKKVKRPSHAEVARTLLQDTRFGTLSTMSVGAETQGYPNAAIAPFAADPQGRPLIALSDLSQHKKCALLAFTPLSCIALDYNPASP